MFVYVLAAALIMATAPLSIQVRPFPPQTQDVRADGDQASAPRPDRDPANSSLSMGQTARTGSGQVGERQSRGVIATQTGRKPLVRVANRIQSRVQNRIRNRVDRDYDPQSNAADPFAVAEDQIRTTPRAR